MSAPNRDPTRFLIIGSSPGMGKTTLGRELARRRGVDFVELDGWVHGPNWTELPTAELRDRLAPVLARPDWVIDGTFEAKLGTELYEHADLVVWMDLPRRVWLPRLLARTFRRVVFREPLWNDNHETLSGVLGGRDALIPFALAVSVRRRREWPARLAPYPTRRLRSRREVADFLDHLGTPAHRGAE